MNDKTFLGRGIYDVREVARLVGRSVNEVTQWSVATQDRDALLFPRDGKLLSFYDLVTAFIVAEFRRRGVPLRKVRDARRTFAGLYDVAWPLAYAATFHDLGTVGSDVYALIGSWFDASQGGQQAIEQVVEPLVERLDFDRQGMASLWRPKPGIVVDPKVQAGAPCLEGTRIATSLIVDLADAGEPLDSIADDYDLDILVVRAAVEFERGLVAA